MVCRLHTFLFADLVGFTRYTAEHGDERAADLAVRFQQRVRAIAAHLGCELVSTQGDAVMVRSDNVPDAVALARALLDLGAQGHIPAVRIGLDTGPAARRRGDWFGSTVNTAARVTAVAAAGELLVTEPAQNACSGSCDVALRPRARIRLKGLGARALYGHTPSAQREAAGARR